MEMKVEKRKEKKHKLTKKNTKPFATFYYIYVFCSLYDRQTNKIFTE